MLFDRTIDLCAEVLYEADSEPIPTNLSLTKEVEGGDKEGDEKKDPNPYPFQRSDFYSVRFFRRDVSFPFLSRRGGRSWSSRFLFRGLHALYFALSHISFVPF